MKFIKKLILAAITSIYLYAGSMTGTAIKINDGDTFVFLNQSTGEKFKVRLFGIDVPEKGQTCGTEAFQVLYEEIFYKKVTIHYEDNKNGFPKTDKYGRIIAIVEVDNKDINRYMVQEGLIKGN